MGKELDQKEKELLAKRLRSVKMALPKKPYRYVIVGSSESAPGRVLLHKSKVSPTDIDAAKRSTKGKRISSGVCYGEKGAIVFEPIKKPPKNLAKIIKRLISDALAKKMKILVRQPGMTPPSGQEAPGLQRSNTQPSMRAPNSEPTGRSSGAALKLVEARENFERVQRMAEEDLDELRSAIVDTFQGDHDLKTAKLAAKEIAGVIRNLKVPLVLKLQELEEAREGGDESNIETTTRGAARHVKTLKSYLGTNETVGQIFDNPFTTIRFREPYRRALDRVAQCILGR